MPIAPKRQGAAENLTLGNLKAFPALERTCGCAAPTCQHTHRESHSRRLLTAKITNTVAGRLPPSAERSMHPKVLVSQGVFAKCPSQTPSGIMWSADAYDQISRNVRSVGHAHGTWRRARQARIGSNGGDTVKSPEAHRSSRGASLLARRASTRRKRSTGRSGVLPATSISERLNHEDSPAQQLHGSARLRGGETHRTEWCRQPVESIARPTEQHEFSVRMGSAICLAASASFLPVSPPGPWQPR